MGVRPWLHRRLARSSDADATEDTAVVSALAIVSAWITHALFGGFLMGAAMPRRAMLTRVLPARFGGFVTPVLLPLFFPFSGVRTRIGLLDSSSDWLLLALLLMATVVKVAGTGLAARLTGSSPREALAIGVLMNTRGLMEVVVLHAPTLPSSFPGCGPRGGPASGQCCPPARGHAGSI
jgi:Kef-type K+ transport system membrane component KefB